MPVVTILSPHADDAALSLAVTMLSLADAGFEIRLITCCSISRHLAAQNGAIDKETVTRTRFREDRSFAELVGAGLIALPCLDAPLRGPGQPLTREPERDEVELLSLLLKSHVIHGTLLVVPLGLGGHVDHKLTRDAAMMAFPLAPSAFYEDVPYSLLLPSRERVEFVRSREREAGRLMRLTNTPPAAKQEAWRNAALACYPSQVTEPLRQLLVDSIQIRGGDGIWATRGFLQLLTERGRSSLRQVR